MDTKKAAELIRNAYKDAKGIQPLREQMENLNEECAYEIQRINTDHWINEGRRVVGRKIGLTSHSVQKQFGVFQPDFGMLYADMSNASGSIIDTSKLIHPRVESEIAFVLSEDLDEEHITVNDIVKATDHLLSAIEVVDSRIKDWNIKFVDTVADNASSGCYVIGNAPVFIEEIDLELCGMVLRRGGEPVSTGAGKACLGNPLIAAQWLANKMVEVGMPLEAGDVILTGALGPMVEVRKGDSFVSSISGFQDITVHFK